MDVIMDFITDSSIMGILQKVVVAILLAAFSYLIRLIIKLTKLRKDMEKLKSTIDEDKERINNAKEEIARHRSDTKDYMNETRNKTKEVEQIREEVRREKDEIKKIALAIDSQRSSAHAHETLLGFGESADVETSEDVNTQILEEYLKLKK